MQIVDRLEQVGLPLAVLPDDDERPRPAELEIEPREIAEVAQASVVSTTRAASRTVLTSRCITAR